LRPLSAYCLQRQDLRGLAMGYGYAPEAAIVQHGPALRSVIASALDR